MQRTRIQRPLRKDPSSVTTPLSRSRAFADDVEAPPQLAHSLDTIPVLPPHDAAAGDAHGPADSIPSGGGVIQRAILTSRGEPYKNRHSLQSAAWYRNLGTREKNIATAIHDSTFEYTGKKNVTIDEALEAIRNRTKVRSNVMEESDLEHSQDEIDRFDNDDDSEKQKRSKKKEVKSTSNRSNRSTKGGTGMKPIVIDDSDDERKEEKSVESSDDEYLLLKKPTNVGDDFEIVIEYDDDDPILKSARSARDLKKILNESDEESDGSHDGTDRDDPLPGNDALSEQSDDSEQSSSSEESPPRKKRKGSEGKKYVMKNPPKQIPITKRSHSKTRVSGSMESSKQNLKKGRRIRKRIARNLDDSKSANKATRGVTAAFVTLHVTTTDGRTFEKQVTSGGKIASFINMKSVETLPQGKLSKIRKESSVMGVMDTGDTEKNIKKTFGLTGDIQNTSAHAEVGVSAYLIHQKTELYEEMMEGLKKGEGVASVTIRVDIDKPACTGCDKKMSIAHRELSAEWNVPVFFSMIYPEKRSNEDIRKKYQQTRTGLETVPKRGSNKDLMEESHIAMSYSSDEVVSDDESDEEYQRILEEKKRKREEAKRKREARRNKVEEKKKEKTRKARVQEVEKTPEKKPSKKPPKKSLKRKR